MPSLLITFSNRSRSNRLKYFNIFARAWTSFRIDRRFATSFLLRCKWTCNRRIFIVKSAAAALKQISETRSDENRGTTYLALLVSLYHWVFLVPRMLRYIFVDSQTQYQRHWRSANLRDVILSGHSATRAIDFLSVFFAQQSHRIHGYSAGLKPLVGSRIGNPSSPRHLQYPTENSLVVIDAC